MKAKVLTEVKGNFDFLYLLLIKKINNSQILTYLKNTNKNKL